MYPNQNSRLNFKPVSANPVLSIQWEVLSSLRTTSVQPIPGSLTGIVPTQNILAFIFSQVSKVCVAEVMKTMHQRAADVRLLPHIQLSCISDLTTLCAEKVEPGEV
jgi:hypothetical protein